MKSFESWLYQSYRNHLGTPADQRKHLLREMKFHCPTLFPVSQQMNRRNNVSWINLTSFMFPFIYYSQFYLRTFRISFVSLSRVVFFVRSSPASSGGDRLNGSNGPGKEWEWPDQKSYFFYYYSQVQLNTPKVKIYYLDFTITSLYSSYTFTYPYPTTCGRHRL